MTTQALEAAKTRLEASETRHAENKAIAAGLGIGEWEAFMPQEWHDLNAAITSLTEPFSAKHLDGWVKDDEVKNYWKLGKWRLQYFEVTDSYEILSYGGRRFFGHIPTASFFHALCGALNIKP